MVYMEEHNIPGLLMSIDFEKAFDLVSWNFLYTSLQLFGFDDNCIKWIKLFNTDMQAYVLQSGFLSGAIPIQRGCRQGDPIAPYLFLIVAEILSLLIENNSDIKGIRVGTVTIKLAQFADDTTILLDGSLNSLQATLNVLEIFGTLTGLKVNCEKTKLIWLGSEKNSSEKLEVKGNFEWGTTHFTVLGLQFSTNLSLIPDI